METKSAIDTDLEQKYISFRLGEAVFGVSVLQVIEIVKIENMITIPHAHKYFLGLMDIRGSVVPVVDLSTKLEIESDNHKLVSGAETRAIITEIGDKRVGLGVDKVTHVMQFPPQDIDRGASPIKGSSGRCVIGVGKHREDLVVLMDLRNLFTTEEVGNYLEGDF